MGILDMFKIPEQKKFSPFWGGIKELLSRAMFYIGIINFILIMITAYHTSIKDIMPVPFWIFFMTLTVVLFIVMVFEYVVVLPSSIAFSNRQSYKHDNPLKDDITKVLSKLNSIEQQLRLSEQQMELYKRQLESSDKQIKILERNIEELLKTKE